MEHIKNRGQNWPTSETKNIVHFSNFQSPGRQIPQPMSLLHAYQQFIKSNIEPRQSTYPTAHNQPVARMNNEHDST